MQTSKTPLTVRLGTAVLALGLAGTLAACGGKDSSTASSTTTATSSTTASAPSASSTPSASATPTVKPTVIKDLSALTVTPATVGKQPTVTAKWPLAIEKTTVKVLTEGTGATVAKGATVKVDYQGTNARDGKVFDQSFGKQPAVFSLDGVIPGFTKAIEGQKLGSRVLVMMTSADGYAEGQPSAGIQKGDNLVFVVDILDTEKAVAQRADLPQVSDDKEKRPVIKATGTTAPTASTSAVIRQGLGEKIGAKDTIQYTYRAFDWATGQVLEDSAAGAQAGQAAPAQGDIARMPATIQKALVGQTAGSRVLVVVTPRELDAAAQAASPSATPTAKNTHTVVYVIDVLATQAGA